LRNGPFTRKSNILLDKTDNCSLLTLSAASSNAIARSIAGSDRRERATRADLADRAARKFENFEFEISAEIAIEIAVTQRAMIVLSILSIENPLPSSLESTGSRNAVRIMTESRLHFLHARYHSTSERINTTIS